MKFKSISARNKRTGWNIENMQFNPMLTLIVGASGVGKTKVLNVIKTLTRIAKGESFSGLEWKVEFVQNGHDYVWEGEFEIPSEILQVDVKDYEPGKTEFSIVKEVVYDNGELLVNRSSNSIFYKNQELVKLDKAKSIVALLKEEPSVKPIYDGFNVCNSLDSIYRGQLALLESLNNKFQFEIEQIRQFGALVPIECLLLLKNNNYKEFDTISQIFKTIFPTVENIDVIYTKTSDNLSSVVLRIKEKDVPHWIEQPDISSGMFRSLVQIITLVLANDGDVIMIDEFENGLGVNCINELADLIMEPEADIQVVMTSHHPYIINAIPVKDWKILTRNGSDVHVHTAEELHIGEHSKHEAFMQLLQTREYKTGTRN